MLEENKKPSVKGFLRAFGDRWATKMSGPLTVPFALLALFVSGTWPKLLFAILAIVCGLVSSYGVWATERNHVVTKNQQLEEVRQALQGIPGPELFLANSSSTGISKHPQLLVKNIRGGTAYRVLVRSISYGGFTANFDEIPLIVEGKDNFEYCQSKDNTGNTLGPLFDAIEKSLEPSVDLSKSVKLPISVSCQDSSGRTFIHEFECEYWPFAPAITFTWKGRRSIAAQS
jgi:hypothetical protein